MGFPKALIEIGLVVNLGFVEEEEGASFGDSLVQSFSEVGKIFPGE